MNDKQLRSKLIRLAHARPELRPALLPLLTKPGKQAAAGRYLKDTKTAQIATLLEGVAKSLEKASDMMFEVLEAEEDSKDSPVLLLISPQYQKDFKKSFDELSGPYAALSASIKAKGLLVE